MAMTIITINIKSFLLLLLSLEYYSWVLNDTQDRSCVSVFLIEWQWWQLGKIIFPFKNLTQVDLNGFEVKHRDTSRLTIRNDRSKCILLDCHLTYIDILYNHWDIVVHPTKNFNAIMLIVAIKLRKSAPCGTFLQAPFYSYYSPFYSFYSYYFPVCSIIYLIY